MSDNMDIWHEVQVREDGVSITTYSQQSGEHPTVEDETWKTWSELDDVAVGVLRKLKMEYAHDSDKYADISQTIHYLMQSE